MHSLDIETYYTKNNNCWKANEKYLLFFLLIFFLEVDQQFQSYLFFCDPFQKNIRRFFEKYDYFNRCNFPIIALLPRHCYPYHSDLDLTTSPGVVPIVLYCNSICKVLQYIGITNFQSIAIFIAKSQSIAINITDVSKYCKMYCNNFKVLQKVLQQLLQNFKVLQKVFFFGAAESF